MSQYLFELIRAHKSGAHAGICSACSSSETAIRAVLRFALDNQGVALIESTANQVNQLGGYTGMRPADFVRFVRDLSVEIGLPSDQLLLGGDHLGPLVWKNEPEASAMEKAEALVAEYVEAGYRKIHIDTSMRLANDDPKARLSDEIIANRAVRLFGAAHRALVRMGLPERQWPVFVIGSEVPIPGGAQAEETVEITRPQDFKNTVARFHDALTKAGLDALWSQVIAVVVQPGVEFGDAQVHPYSRPAAKDLMHALSGYPSLVFEGHSTDYQTPEHLREMVADGICILKVGPALTFAEREALFALDAMERELAPQTGLVPTNLRATLERIMLAQPENWQAHYRGTPEEQAFKRMFSLSDRARYYFPLPEMQACVQRLMRNLSGVALPYTLLSQYMPVQAARVRDGKLPCNPAALIEDRIQDCLRTYQYASKP